MSLEKKVEQLSFQVELLLGAVDWTNRPFERAVLQANLSRADVDAFYELLDELQRQKNEQERYGLTSIEPLLVRFVGMLHPNLDPLTILEACVKQRIAIDLTEPLYRQVTLLD